MALALSITVVSSILTAVQPPVAAEAISGSEFNPGHIISDAEFYKNNAMSEAEIQAFLVSKGSGLKTYRSSAASRARLVSDSTGNLRCDAFQGGTNLLSSTIIYRAQVACGISARVILVVLQKEQGLITKSAPSQGDFDWALGQGCPDTAKCDPKYKGFANQIYYGTLQLNTYKAANFGNYRPGVNRVNWHPNAGCGTSTFTIQNHATAALYNYTPYRPNQAALNNLRGLGDGCSSYGNRNFWVFYNDWFGSPTDIHPQGISVGRIGGVDRYDTAVKISGPNFDSATTTVYVANGQNFPDALSAAPAAASMDAPLLLVRPNSISAAVKTEIQRLTPTQIVVVGGTGAVSDAVISQLQAIAPTASIRRDGGVDRFESSRMVARSAFSATGSAVAYVATGYGFPDALSASAAAGSINAPVILVDGGKTSLDVPTTDLLTSLGVTKVVIAGGTGVVSPGMEAALRLVPGVTSVDRHGGVDRYATSAAINASAFTASQGVHVASGLNFPDALAAAAVAGKNKAPLYLVRNSCFEKPILQHIVDIGATSMVVYGGAAVVGSGVEKFANCK